MLAEQVLLSPPMRTALLSPRARRLDEAAKTAAAPLHSECSVEGNGFGEGCSADNRQSSQLGAVQLLASHGDQVTRLPPGAELLGWSAGSPHELFLCGPHKNMLCCQVKQKKVSNSRQLVRVIAAAAQREVRLG